MFGAIPGEVLEGYFIAEGSGIVWNLEGMVSDESWGLLGSRRL